MKRIVTLALYRFCERAHRASSKLTKRLATRCEPGPGQSTARKGTHESELFAGLYHLRSHVSVPRVGCGKLMPSRRRREPGTGNRPVR